MIFLGRQLFSDGNHEFRGTFWEESFEIDDLFRFCPGFVLNIDTSCDRAINNKEEGPMYKLIVFVPETAKETLKSALFRAGAGSFGAYSHCAWECLGTGQFLPGDAAHPHIGTKGSIAYVPEWGVEMLVPDQVLESVKDALCYSHPYEEPAFDLLRVEDVSSRT